MISVKIIDKKIEKQEKELDYYVYHGARSKYNVSYMQGRLSALREIKHNLKNGNNNDSNKTI